MYRLALAAPLLGIVLAATPVTAASTTRYVAHYDHNGITGRVVVTLDNGQDRGTLSWNLTGLRKGDALVIDVDGGMCTDPDGGVVWHKTDPLTVTTAEGSVALPDGSANYFRHDLATRGGVNALVKSGARHACSMFAEKA